MKVLKIFFLIFLCSCTSIFYQPDRYLYSDPHQFQFVFENVKVNSSNAVQLHVWHFKNIAISKCKGVILFFHGNAQNISAHYPALAWASKFGYDVISIDYRGYGLSTGIPSQKGLYEDALAALDYTDQYVRTHKLEKFIVYGQSLGGNVSMRALGDFANIKAVSLLVLDSTFLSYKKVANDRLKSLWVTWPLSPLAWILISDEYSPQNMLGKITIPTLVIHGNEDQVIPYYFGREVFSKLPEGKKIFWDIPGGKHIDIFFREDVDYRSKFISYIDSL